MGKQFSKMLPGLIKSSVFYIERRHFLPFLILQVIPPKTFLILFIESPKCWKLHSAQSVGEQGKAQNSDTSMYMCSSVSGDAQKLLPFCISTTIGTAGAQSTEKDSSAKCLASCALCAMSRVKKQIYFDTGKRISGISEADVIYGK